MADISAFSPVDIAGNASTNFGPNAVTNQAAQAAGTAQTQALTQGQQIQNQSARLQYQLFARGMQHLTDFSGQDGPHLGDAKDDASGVTPTSALPTTGGKVTPEMDVGASAADQAKI